MSVPKFNPRTVVLISLVVLVAALRLLTYFSKDFAPFALLTPLGTLAIFGGAYFNGYVKPSLTPVLTLFISDMILSYTIFAQYRNGFLYPGWYWTYGAFALMAIAGKLIIKEVNAMNILAAIIASTIIHWLVSDIGGCLLNGNPSFTVYLQRLVTALPYELRLLAGTTVYSAAMFGIFEWMHRKYPVLKAA